MSIMFVCELPTLKLWKGLNKKQLRYDFWTLMAPETFEGKGHEAKLLFIFVGILL